MSRSCLNATGPMFPARSRARGRDRWHCAAHGPQAVALVKEAGVVLGEVIADAISILNPDRIAIGGTLSAAGDLLLDGLREAVMRRALPIATDDLSIVAVEHSPQLGLIGAAILVRELELSPARADATVRRLSSGKSFSLSEQGS